MSQRRPTGAVGYLIVAMASALLGVVLQLYVEDAGGLSAPDLGFGLAIVSAFTLAMVTAAV